MIQRSMGLLGAGSPAELAIREAAWVARCVGRGDAAPFTPEDLAALAASLRTASFERGGVVFHGGSAPAGVWIVRHGRVELSVGSGRKRAVVHVLRSGDVDGDIQHLLDMPLPYTAHTLDEATVLFLGAHDFETCWPAGRRSPAAGCPAWRCGWPPARTASSGCSAGR